MAIFQLVFLPQPEAQSQAGDVLGNPTTNYGHAISKILSPEQLQIWQQNMKEDVQNQQ